MTRICRCSVLSACAALLALTVLANPAEARPFAPRASEAGGPAAVVAPDATGRAVASAASVDSVVLARFDFDDETGGADPQGWTLHDLTYEPNDELFFHVDDFTGLSGYAPLAGARSLWCGSRTVPGDLGGGNWPGYGNRWAQIFQSVPLTVTGNVHLSFLLRHDTEEFYDYVLLEYRSTGEEWTQLVSFSGAGTQTVTADIPASSHAGSVTLRVRFDSDDAWSDEDALLDTHGAFVLDDLTVQDGAGVVDHQDFETESVGAHATADGHWFATVYAPFGSYGGLVSGAGVLQEDPAITNATHLWGFFIGSPDNYGCGGHPEQLAVPHDRVSTPQTRFDCLKNEIRSPWIPLDRDERGALLVEVPDTLSLQYQVYRDLTLARGVVYTYRARFRYAGEARPWVPAGFVWFGAGKDWYSPRHLIPVPAGALEVQIGLVAWDYGFALYASDPCHSHAPLLDNVRLTAAGIAFTGFNEVAILEGTSHSNVDWGDYDNDGDLDVLLTGALDAAPHRRTQLYRNSGGTLAPVTTGLPSVSYAGVDWGDYDSDGDLDLLLAGGFIAQASGVYRNNVGSFTDAGAGLPLVRSAAVAWGDCDNDGDLDLVLTGGTSTTPPYAPLSRVYRNNGGTFTDINAGLSGMTDGTVAWGDYDRDGDLDLVLAGMGADGNGLSSIYRNDGGVFANIGAGLPGATDGAAAWADYDNDGDLDLALTGYWSAGCGARVYRNDGGAFVDAGAGLPDVARSTVAWGDYDNDGDPDLLLAGWSAAGPLSRIYRNDGGAFTDIVAGLPGVQDAAAAWGDYDNDGDLDLLLTGHTGTESITRLYRNDESLPHAPPPAPKRLSAGWAAGTGTEAWFAWVDPGDKRASTPGLTYSLRIGTTPGGQQVMATMANPSSGYRCVAAAGNMGTRCAWHVILPAGGQYYWSVQAVNGAFAGGPFAPEQSLQIPTEVRDEATPGEFALRANAPNPFNPATTIRFDLPRTERVRLVIYDLSGREVRVLLDGTRPAGRHEVRWNGDDGRGRQMASGVYFCRMEAGAFRETGRMTLVR